MAGGTCVEDHPALVGGKGGVWGSLGGVEGSVVESCTGLCGCWGHLWDKATLGGISMKNKNILWQKEQRGDGE